MELTDIKKILLLGFGRMGLSHALQISGILRNRNQMHEIFIIENSLIAKILAKSIFKIKVKILKNTELNNIRENFFDYAVDATPPFNRKFNISLLEKISKNYLIEKPVLCKLGAKGMSGYVLQHNPLINALSKSLIHHNLKSIDIKLITNLNFEDEGGWRSGQFGGVINEFLGHLLSVPLACIKGINNYKIIDLTKRDNLLKLNLNTSLCNICIELEHGNSSVRKTAYSWEFITEDGDSFMYDNYQIIQKSKNSNIKIGLASSGANSEFYLRGFDFSNQSIALIDGLGDKISKNQLLMIDEIIREVINWEKAL